MEIIVTFIFFILASGILTWAVYTLVGEFGGAAFVPTNQTEINQMLQKLGVKPGKVFYDLGSGDGRVVKTAVDKYGVLGVGFEINPWLVWWSKLKTKKGNPKFLRKNFWSKNLGNADFIYFYLGPRAAKRLGEKIPRECKKGTVIISKAFEMKTIKNKLTNVNKIEGKKYFYYRI